MKHLNPKLFALLFAAMLFSFGTASAQFIQTNNSGIFPVGGINPAINFNVQFASMGESGGVPGPTPNGCDLYGFRAQINAVNAVNLGMNAVGFGTLTIPTLSFENGSDFGASDRFWITNQNSGAPGTGFTGCGTLLAYYSESTGAGSTVYTILGSGLASGGMWNPSDRGLKRDIKPIGSALDMVQQLNGVTYRYRTAEHPSLNLPAELQYGFITQEVQTVMPTAVKKMADEHGEETDHQMMRYDAIIPVLTEAIKEQQIIIEGQQDAIETAEKTIQQQQDIIARFEARLAALEGASPARTGLEGFELGQNRPNPAGTSTTIDYQLPTDAASADLVIYDMAGRTISSYSLQNGANQIKVNTEQLASGTYVYAIVQEGRSIARRKMIIQ
ncbi:MAG: tail fiber domain-containing protein [Bacteroidota bacterium]